MSSSNTSGMKRRYREGAGGAAGGTGAYRGAARAPYQRRLRLTPFSKPPSVYRFSEKCMSPITISAPPSAVGGGITWGQMDELLNIGSFRNLFDLYKITAMELTVLPAANSADVNGTTGFLPYLYIAPNRNPTVPAPTGIADILNDDQVKVVRLDRPHTFKLAYPKPRLADETGTGVPFQFAPTSGGQPWLSTGGNGGVDQTSVPHYGFRWAVDNSLNPGDFKAPVVITLHFELKEQD